jgi:AAA+ superfamily predicted ATPase
LFKKLFFLEKEKSYFSIDKEKDFYYLVSFKNTEFAFTRTKEEAESLVAQMNNITDWKPFKSIIDMYETDLSEYKKVLPTIQKYAVKVRRNGNYRNEWKETGVLKYRVNFGQMVTAQEELAPGVAMRKQGGDYCVDLIIAAQKFKEFNTEDQARKFIAKTQAWIPWHEEKVLSIIEKDREVQTYLKNLEWELINGSEITKPSPDMISDFLFKNFGEDDQEKKAIYKETIKRLDKMVGLKQIKDYVQNLFKMISAEQKLQALNIGVSNPEMHALFVGPAGTGKTEVARMYGDILWSLNKIPERKIIEVSKEDLVSPYIGETEIKTKEVIERAKGGILFVDEAYMLAGNGGDQGKDYGKIALEIIMRAMENERGNLVVVFAGYEKDIEKLMEVNEGLRSRFSKTFRFEDYSTDELVKIAHKMINAEGFESDDVDKELQTVISSQHKNGQMSGNARNVRKMIAEIVSNHKLRIVENNGNFYKIHPEDVRMVNKKKETRSQETIKKMQESAIAKLDSLIGLNQLKKEIKTWSNYIKVEKKREEMNLSSNKISLHMTFKGSPGTGKTTVARIMGDILQSNGLLSRGHFKEVTRSDLVAEYMGQTSIKVKKLMKEMEGGVLFIDEAYSLVQGENDVYGKEAVDTLIAEMENKRDDLVVILAGYSNEIEELLESNPGFKSRISNNFEFQDYSANELVDLLKMNITAQNLILTSEAESKITHYIFEEKQKNNVDGNGRWVRNVVDKLKKNQANRLAESNEFTEKSIMTIEAADAL